MNLTNSNKFCDKLSKENKTLLLLGDFHINLMTKKPEQMNFLIPCLLIYFYIYETYIKETGLNLTKKTLSLMTFQLIGIRH